MRMFRALVAGLILCGTLSFTTDAQTSATAPAARPVLVIQSTPGGVQVYVDDELFGMTSPEGRLKISTLKPGKHTLRLSLDGRSYGEGQFTLVTGKTLTKAVTLTEQNAAGNPAAARPGNAGNGTPGASTGGPSLSDTLNWIRDTLQNDQGAGYAYEQVLTPLDGSSLWDTQRGQHTSLRQDNGCQITLLTEFKNFSVNPGASLTTTGNSATSVDLSELDPDSTAATTFQVQSSTPSFATSTVSGDRYTQVSLKATNNRPVFSTRSTWISNGLKKDVSPTSEAIGGFAVGAPDLASRLVSAFKHAIQLCGGKPSTF